ncbi:VanW family protein [Candidatus Peregrinibacteria bacterium]|nr:VanW family protein [Candidatus Peregrinibacteria bacterium]
MSVFAADEIPILWKQNLTLKHEYRSYKLDLNKYADQFFIKRKNTQVLTDPLHQNTFCTNDSKESPEEKWELNIEELKKFLREDVAPKIQSTPTNVTISRDEKGNIIFDGYATFGEELDIDVSTEMIQKAILSGIDKVTLFVKKTDPEITVNDEELRSQGIQNLISVGWSDFSRSPVNRIHNIGVGASKINGVLVPKGEIFSFDRFLGNVDESTGYKKELVIVGPQTIPEYGGGLCQVSTTTCRGAMIAGFPIVQRKNHSYQVTYYSPVGSDCTIYPPSVDFKFLNDTNGAVLIQTRKEKNELFFHYYGTRDARKVAILGPYTKKPVAVPPPKYTTSSNVPPGETEKLSGEHPGIDATWFRQVTYPPKETSENTKGDRLIVTMANKISPELALKMTQENIFWQTFFSHYEARGLWVVTGAEKQPESPAPEVVPDGNWL